MAAIGLKYMAWAPMASEPDDAAPTYGTGIVLGRAVSTNLTITNAEGELYADDMLAEYVSEFASGELAAEVDNIAVENQAKLYGATYADGEMQMGGQDTAPYGGVVCIFGRFFCKSFFCKSSGFTCIFPAYALKYPLNSHLGKGVILWLHYWQNYLSGIMKTSRIPAFARHMECSAVSSGFFST